MPFACSEFPVAAVARSSPTYSRCGGAGSGCCEPTKGGRRGVSLNGNSMAVIDSYVSDFKEVGSDSQAVFGFNGFGPFKIVNNSLEAASENILFGGAAPRIGNLVPSDIEIRHNVFSKPLSWKQSNYNV